MIQYRNGDDDDNSNGNGNGNGNGNEIETAKKQSGEGITRLSVRMNTDGVKAE